VAFHDYGHPDFPDGAEAIHELASAPAFTQGLPYFSTPSD
jgi:hypothetical protein